MFPVNGSANFYLESELDRDSNIWLTWVHALPAVAYDEWQSLYEDSDPQERFEMKLLAGYLYPPYMEQESPFVIAHRLVWALHDLTHSYCHNHTRDPHKRSATFARLISRALNARAPEDFHATRQSVHQALGRS